MGEQEPWQWTGGGGALVPPTPAVSTPVPPPLEGPVTMEPRRRWLFRRRSLRERAGLLLVSLTASVLLAIVGIVPALIQLTRSTADAEEALDRLEWPTTDAAPATPTAPRASDGVYGLKGYTVLAGEPSLEGAPGGDWVPAEGDSSGVASSWTSGGCTFSARQASVATFGALPEDGGDRSWTEEELAVQEWALRNHAADVAPRGADLALRLATADGHALEAIGRVYDTTPTPGSPAVEAVVAARTLVQHGVSEDFLLMCPAGTLTDPAGTIQDLVDGFHVALG